MTLPIRSLPILEPYDCTGCGLCCRGTIVNLDGDDLGRLAEQRWGDRPEFRGVQIIRRHGWLRPTYTLGKRPDGSCIFLDTDGLCRIHKELGEAAKPVVCRMFPFQLVPLGDHARVTLRRFCPAAAAEEGRPIDDHMAAIRELAQQGRLAEGDPPPAVGPGRRRPWLDLLRATDPLERMLRDERYPPVRRLAHGLAYCNLLAQCRLRRLSDADYEGLLRMLQSAAVSDAGVAAAFEHRRPAGARAANVFRQIVFESLPLLRDSAAENTWSARWRTLHAALAFWRGRGPLPALASPVAAKSFGDLERPLGALPPEVFRPLAAYLEANGAARRYLLLGRHGWSAVEAFWTLPLGYAVGLYVLRMRCGDRAPTREDMISVVGMLDRSQTSALLTGHRHRRRVRWLARSGELLRLLTWYGR